MYRYHLTYRVVNTEARMLSSILQAGHLTVLVCGNCPAGGGVPVRGPGQCGLLPAVELRPPRPRHIQGRQSFWV